VLYAVQGQGHLHWRIAFGSFLDAFSVEVRRETHDDAGDAAPLGRAGMLDVLAEEGGVLRFQGLSQVPLVLFLGGERAVLGPQTSEALWGGEDASWPDVLAGTWIALNPSQAPFVDRDPDGPFAFVGTSANSDGGDPLFGQLVHQKLAGSAGPKAVIHCNNFSSRPGEQWTHHFSSAIFEAGQDRPLETAAPGAELQGGQGTLAWRYARYELSGLPFVADPP
jgi:hypothetical protein